MLYTSPVFNSLYCLSLQSFHCALWILIFSVNTLSCVLNLLTVDCLNVTELRITSKVPVILMYMCCRARKCWWWYWSFFFKIILLCNPVRTIRIHTVIPVFSIDLIWNLQIVPKCPLEVQDLIQDHIWSWLFSFPSLRSSSSAFLCI